MKSKIKYAFVAFLCVLVAITYCNWKYEVIAIHPFFGDDQYELKVMTWNVHCPNGADSKRQRDIAELIIKEDADFVLLNEYKLDSCQVMDSLLKMRYPYTEECRSHRINGDIFYSKREMTNSGYARKTENGKRKRIRTIKATIAIGSDSVQISGLSADSPHPSAPQVLQGLLILHGGRAFRYQQFDETLEKVLDELDRLGIKATCFCLGKVALMDSALREWFEGGEMQ